MRNYLFRSIVVLVLTVSLLNEYALSNVITDFEDQTSQGWTLLDPANSDYLISNNGHPGFALLAQDTAAGEWGPVIVAPDSYHGNLSQYDGIKWDEYIFYQPVSVRVRDGLLIRFYGTDGTWYHSGDFNGQRETWTERYIPFEEQYWTKKEDSGNMSFEEVFSNVIAVQIVMECSSTGTNEAVIDNITLVPEPCSFIIFGIGTLLSTKRAEKK